MALFWKVFTLVFLAELGDKTQLATMGMSADHKHAPWIIFAGSCAALILSTALATLVGQRLGSWISPKVIKLCGGALFLLMGFLMLRDGIRT